MTALAPTAAVVQDDSTADTNSGGLSKLDAEQASATLQAPQQAGTFTAAQSVSTTSTPAPPITFAAPTSAESSMPLRIDTGESTGESGSGSDSRGLRDVPQLESGFFTALFNYRFDRFASTGLIRLIYIVGSAFIGLDYLVGVIAMFSFSSILGFLALIGGGIAALLALAFLRTTLEFFFAVVRMSEDIHHRL